jgi:hypothetical protein
MLNPRIKMFENILLKGIFGPKNYNEELLRSTLVSDVIRMIKSRRMKWVAHVGRKRSACRILVRKPEGKIQLRRHRYKW